MPYKEYLALTMYDRWVLHGELREQVEATNPETGDSIGGSTRPKKIRQMR